MNSHIVVPTLTESKLGDKSTHIQTCASQVHGPPFKTDVSDFQTEETDSFKWSKFNIFDQLLSPFIFLKVFLWCPWRETMSKDSCGCRNPTASSSTPRLSLKDSQYVLILWEKRVVSTLHSFCSPSSSGSQRQPVGRHTESSLTKRSARGPFYWRS